MQLCGNNIPAPLVVIDHEHGHTVERECVLYVDGGIQRIRPQPSWDTTAEDRREPDGEARPAPGTLTEGGDRAAVRLDEGLDDRQSKPQARMDPGCGSICLAELMKH